ncbi:MULTISPECIES: LemA family protein [Blautia]|uniref:LemA family protein n=1 Tax=Blautia ammoniilytica TaxID=2981782 RepID=A0ABT2TS26_9FIRM|nr:MULTISPECIES: LemA family protein [Blautia]MCU6765040.1 LemA family protein [Blautia ammoniilytica]NSJ28228.1 LemA family protein [Blautia glucerasea]SCH79212.1 LemA family [uncultured Blautia sp.]
MLKIVIIVLAIVVLLVLWLVSSYNGFVRLRNKSEEAFSAMDVSLKKRYDLIPNFVETVKGYAKHEQDTLQAVINARNMAMNANSPEQKIANDNALSGTLKSLFALTESYPDLKANQNFLSLQNQLSRIEEEIAGSRRYYNGVVNKYNTKTEMFPGNILASLFGFKRKPLYEVNSDAERENVKVSF